MRGLVLACIALLVASLSGCVSSSSDRFFPPAKDLPDGLVPVSTESSEWKLVAPYLGMSSNPGRVGAFDSLPRHDLGNIAEVEAYLLQTNTSSNQGPGNYGVMVLTFNGTADVGSYLKQGEAHACDAKDVAHLLKDGLVYAIVSGDASTEHAKAILDHLAGAVQARSGATVVC